MVEFMKVKSAVDAGDDRHDDRHGELVTEWIASAIKGITEMHQNEQARQQVAARLF